MGIFCSICIFLCATFSGNCQESPAHWIEKADESYSYGQFNDAAIAYERAIYLGFSGNKTGILKLKKADCYKQLKNFQKALRELETIFLPSMPDSIQNTVIYQKALCHYLNHNSQEAESWIQQLPSEFRSSEIRVLEILIYADLLQWEKARDQTIFLIGKFNSGTSRDSLMMVCKQIFNHKHQPKIKREKTAAMLSTFFPGAGQVYTGNVGRGVLAFSFTAGSIGIAALEVMNGFYITGYVVGLGFFQKFYFGGIEQSRRLAIERNSRKVEKYNASIKKLVFASIK